MSFGEPEQIEFVFFALGHAAGGIGRRPDLALEDILERRDGHGFAEHDLFARTASRPGAEAAREVLEFTMPTAPALEKFDELTVVFRLRRGRQDKSARVEIDRFVLVP